MSRCDVCEKTVDMSGLIRQRLLPICIDLNLGMPRLAYQEVCVHCRCRLSDVVHQALKDLYKAAQP